MDSTIEQSSLPTQPINHEVLPNHSVKYFELQKEHSKIDYPQSDTNSTDDDDDEYTFEEAISLDNEEEEYFEDALDEVIANNFMDCINDSESVLNDAQPRTSASPNLINETLQVGINESNKQNNIQILLEKQRNELALELRRLQYSNRPRETRDHLEQIFNHAIANNNSNNTAIRNHNSRVSEQEQIISPSTYRSENVLNEISNLNSRQMVSSIQSSFRESIERTLRQRIDGPRSAILQNERINRSRALVQANAIPTSPPVINVIPTLPPVINRIPIPPSRTSVIEPTALQRTETPRPTDPYLVTRQNNPFHEAYREDIITEISDLVHRELVSSSLQSDFRQRLERNIRERMTRSGIDGNRTRQNIREFMINSRVTSNVQRNDFSHLGINTRNNLTDPTENLDSASSVHSGHRQTRTTVVHHNTREIRELKNELQEMKSMLKLSFEMQMDMQRSFKQEISALVAGTFHDTASSRLVNSSKPRHEGKCIICTESDCDTVFYSCGHMVSCYSCSLNLKKRGHNCPVCRAPIQDILRTFKSSLD